MNLKKLAEKLDKAQDDLQQAREALQEEVRTDKPLLFAVADLEMALRELHFGQAKEIASRVCKSLTPATGGYSLEEIEQAYQDINGSYMRGVMTRMIAQADKNRLLRSHES